MDKNIKLINDLAIVFIIKETPYSSVRHMFAGPVRELSHAPAWSKQNKTFWVPNHLRVYTAILHMIRISPLDKKMATKQCFKNFLKYTLSNVKHLPNWIQTFKKLFTSQENVHVFSRVSTRLKWLYVNRKIFQFHSLIVHF